MVNAGLNIKGEVDITETRYLCDKHFSGKYINNQARRKMLVHTAIPEKWNEDVDVTENPSFTITGTQPERKRKFRDYSTYGTNDLSSKPANLRLTLKSPPTLLNQRRSSSHFGQLCSPSHEGDDNDSQTTDDQSEETYKIATKMSKIEHDQLQNTFYEEVFLEPKRQKKVQYIVVKPKKKSGEPAMANTLILNTCKREILSEDVATVQEDDREDDTQNEAVYFHEEDNISSTNVEALQDKTPETSPGPEKLNDSMKNYSEFIFNGEKYVQMPKRVFEAEKEKVSREAERYKNLLRKLKERLNKMDL